MAALLVLSTLVAGAMGHGGMVRPAPRSAAGVDPLPQESESPADFPFVVACRNSHIEICDLLLVGVRPDAALRRGRGLPTSRTLAV